MGRFIYRVCLVAVLIVAVAGGVYYYMTFYQKEESPRKGTFVLRADGEELHAERAGRSPAREKEAFVYVNNYYENKE